MNKDLEFAIDPDEIVAREVAAFRAYIAHMMVMHYLDSCQRWRWLHRRTLARVEKRLHTALVAATKARNEVNLDFMGVKLLAEEVGLAPSRPPGTEAEYHDGV